METIEEHAAAFARFPGIGPRQAKRFVYHLLSAPEGERAQLSGLITSIGKSVRQCPECMRYANLPAGRQVVAGLCNRCADATRDNAVLMIVEKDQDLSAVERACAFKGRYFVLGGILTLSGKGAIREKELIQAVEKRVKKGLSEIVLALSATSEGEHTADRVRELLAPLQGKIKISTLGRGLATGSELEYSDAETLRGAFQNRKET